MASIFKPGAMVAQAFGVPMPAAAPTPAAQPQSAAPGGTSAFNALFPNFDLSKGFDANYLSQYRVGGYGGYGGDSGQYVDDSYYQLQGADGKTYRLAPSPDGKSFTLTASDPLDQHNRFQLGFDAAGNLTSNQNWKDKSFFDDNKGILAVLGAAAGGYAAFGGAGAAGAGSGAFVGEGAASGIPAWDGALSASLGGAAGGTGAMGAAAAGAGGIAPSVGLSAGSVGAGAGSAVPEVAASSGGALGGGAAAASSSPWYSSLASKAGSLTAGDIGSAALKYGAPVLSSIIGSNAAKSAANSQAAATDRANALLNLQYNTTRSDLEPWRASGSAAAGALSQKLGIGGNPGASDYGSLTRQFTGADLASDPGYQFGLNQGQKQLDQKAASGGSYYSGAALKAAARYGNDYAGTKFGEAFNRDQASKTQTYNMLSGTSGLGENAAAQTGNFGAQMTGQVANNTTALGTAQGAAQIAGANAINNGLTNLYQNYMQQQQLDSQNALTRAILSGNKSGL